MYDATESFAMCPHGCGVRMIKCLPNEFICPKCKKVFTLLGEQMKHWKELDEKYSDVAIEKCRKVLQSGKYKRVKSIGKSPLSLDERLENLKISKRVRLLTEAGIQTLRDLVVKTADNLFDIDRFGLGCVQQVEKFLSKHGLELGMLQDAIDEYEKTCEIQKYEMPPVYVQGVEVVDEASEIDQLAGIHDRAEYPDNMTVAIDRSLQAADTIRTSLSKFLGVQIEFRGKLTDEVIQLLDAVDPFVSKAKLIKELQNGGK